MSLLSYWPTADEVNNCIKHEAEGAHDAVLLAVHKPTPLTYRMASSGERFNASEEDFFNYLLTMDVPSGVHLVPITGASGVGKSHLVRIMTARLQAMNEDGRYVIIRIPKSASLRKVVELILDKLPGDEYDKVREEFGKALSEDLNVETAVVRFQNELEIALSDLAKVLEQRVRANPGDSALKENLGHAKNLSKFFGDSVLRDHFRKNVFPRFVTRAISGQAQPEDEVHIKDFIGDDFLLPDDLALSTAAVPTHQYYVRNLLVRSREGCRVVAKLLNESKVVDQAIRQLFSLNQSLGGMTLQEVIQQIRRVLLKQNRELVIFVEDFKALTGIQDTLLKVLIQEGVRDGVRQLATMRSVIAVTEGYLDSEDTIKTRAKREWRVESELSDPQEVLRKTKALVASYLNAARWGYGELLRHYESNSHSYAGEEKWIGAFTPDDDSANATTLSGFGKEGEIPLFPFTEKAIEQLAKKVLTRNNALVFTPRFIIDDILRAILLPGRPAFERGQFPSAEVVRAPQLNMEVSGWISSLPFNEDMKERYRRLVAIWGALPSSPSEVGYIPREVFAAFGLPEPDIEFRSPVPNPPLEAPIVQSPSPEARPDDAALTEALERWVQSNDPLPQKLATSIREAIVEGLNERIDWSVLRCTKLKNRDISIPLARGEGNRSTDAFSIAEDNLDSSGQLRRDLAAITRFYDINKGKANYDTVDDDLVAIANFVARLMPKALALVRARIREEIGEGVQLLAMNSRILGLLERGRTPASIHTFLFSKPSISSRPLENAPVEFSNWQALQHAAMQIRPELINLVVERCGSFQGGTGKSAYAIDLVRVLESFGTAGEGGGSNSRDVLPAELKREVAKMSEARVKPVVLGALEKARAMRAFIKDEYGEGFEKQRIVEELRALADQLQGAGSWNAADIGKTHAEFKALCEDFRGAAIIEAISVLDGAVSSGEEQFDAQFLSKVARLDPEPLIVAYRLAGVAKKVIGATERRAKTWEDQFKGVDPKAQVDGIASLFDRLLIGLDELSKDQEAICS